MIPTIVDPTQFSDPQTQQKLAENVLTQLGLHPNQQGARSLLDSHFQSPQATDEIKTVVPQNPLIAAAQTLMPVSDTPNPVKEQVASPTAPKAEPQQPATPQSATPQSASPSTMGSSTPQVPTIPAPNSESRIGMGIDKRTAGDQNELNRLINTGSGIHQIQNPFLRGLARTGEVAGDIFTPRIVQDIPGTEAHHNALINNEEKRIGTDINEAGKEATTEHEREQTQKELQTPVKVDELTEWMKENPGKPLSEYWEQKAKAQFGKLTPQQQAMKYMTTPREEGGLGLDPQTSFNNLEKMVNDAKPETTAQQKGKIDQLIAKTMPNGQMDPKMMSDPNAIIDHISKSDQLTPQEKSRVYSYLTLNTTPASQGQAASIRTGPQCYRGLQPAIDKTNGELVIIDPLMVKNNPDRYMGATSGASAMSKEAAFKDIDFNTQNTEDAIQGLKTPFDAGTTAQFLLAMRSNDPHRAFNQFISSETAKNLQPDQIDFLTSLAALNENALALRSIQGLGQGSDELRAAITKMIPGPGTPSKEYALRQMELFKGTVARAKTGVPKTGIPAAPQSTPETTKQIQDEQNNPPSGELTKAQVQAQVDQWNKAHPEKQITYDDAVKDAEAHHYKVKEQ